MLDQTTKRKLDSARQILVGKVPDPKAQVEQITTALIYKFMDDMDKENEEVGLKTQFFVDDWKKFSWTKLLDNKLSGQDRLDLYVQAITSMPKNPHLPQLFRNIFKGAFLPYNDPRTLSLFLKEINEFNYEHSENLGNAFEYLLSILGSQGDAGQFRTPRHIIDFIVEVIDPKKNETILDPACGTAGFLISAYKHIVKNNDGKDNTTGKPTKNETPLTPDEKLKLMNNIAGYDISPDMVKLALVNMYLHGFPEPKIHEYDTLSSEKRWDETFDVIMANPPFMTPKGGIVPHKRFSIQANRAEVLFVDYIVEHLTIKGRAGIIVPEGIIFQSNKVYKALRKKLVEDGLFAVVSLPAGVFNPYSGVKTSILFFDNELAKRTDEILFVKVENDGFDLGAQRRDSNKNDLPEALKILQQWQKNQKIEDENDYLVTENGDNLITDNGDKFIVNDQKYVIVKKSKIAESGDCNLTGDRYRETIDYSNMKWPMVELGEICDILNGYAFKSKQFNCIKNGLPIIRIRDINSGFSGTYYDGEYDNKYLIYNGDLLIGMDGDFRSLIWDNGKSLLNQRVCKLHNFRKTYKTYVFYLLQRQLDIIHKNTFAVTVKHISSLQIEKIKIPLPPLEIQEQIVTELDGYQKVIDGARQVVENWKPTIKINPGWEKVKLGEVCEFNPKKSEVQKLPKNYLVSFVPMVDLKEKQINFEAKQEKEIQSVYSGYTYFANNDVLLARVTPCFENGKSGIARNLKNNIGFGSSEYLVYRPKKEKIMSEWMYYFISSNKFIENGKSNMSGTGGLQRLTNNFAKNYEISVPSIDIQKQIVDEIENERKIVEKNKKLIEIFEGKIKEKIDEVWGDKNDN